MGFALPALAGVGLQQASKALFTDDQNPTALSTPPRPGQHPSALQLPQQQQPDIMGQLLQALLAGAVQGGVQDLSQVGSGTPGPLANPNQFAPPPQDVMIRQPLTPVG